MGQNSTDLSFDSSSSNIARVEFKSDLGRRVEPDENIGQLTVTFNHQGSVYEYDDVPLSLFLQLQEAEQTGQSVGKLFAAEVRHQFRCEKVSS